MKPGLRSSFILQAHVGGGFGYCYFWSPCTTSARVINLVRWGQMMGAWRCLVAEDILRPYVWKAETFPRKEACDRMRGSPTELECNALLKGPGEHVFTINRHVFQVSLLSLELLQASLCVSGDVLAPYLHERVTSLVERSVRFCCIVPVVADRRVNWLHDSCWRPFCPPGAVEMTARLALGERGDVKQPSNVC